MVFYSLEEDVKQADQVCGTGLVFRMELDTEEGEEEEEEQGVKKKQGCFIVLVGSSRQRPEGGDLNRGLVLCTMPSLVWSLALVKRTSQSSGRVSGSTAKP